MGLLDFLKQRKLKRGIKDAEWRAGTVEMAGVPDALADLGQAHAKAGDLNQASKYFADASREASKFERTRKLAPKFKKISNDYQSRMAA